MQVSTRNALVIGLICFAIVIVGGAIYSDNIGHDPGYLLTIAITLIPLIGTIVYQNDKATADLKSQVQDVKTTVNGSLDKKLSDLESRLKTHIDTKTTNDAPPTSNSDSGE